ncbi:hypothetical protein EK904_008487 [Melospiza melodia maxima]|nr:hypothetical protein EK904_008487 [Melospiza melodia maxima]
MLCPFISSALQNVRIDPSSISFQMWKDIPVPFYLSVHFFEVLNPKQVLRGEKPVLSQRGPYVYRSGAPCAPAWHGPDLCCLPACCLAPLAGGHGISSLTESPGAMDLGGTQMCSSCSDLAEDTGRSPGH